jgi:hypothetical protein
MDGEDGPDGIGRFCPGNGVIGAHAAHNAAASAVIAMVLIGFIMKSSFCARR